MRDWRAWSSALPTPRPVPAAACWTWARSIKSIITPPYAAASWPNPAGTSCAGSSASVGARKPESMNKKKQNKNARARHGEAGHLCDDACEHIDDLRRHDDEHGHEHGHRAHRTHAPTTRGVYLVSPSSAVHNPEALDLACERLAAEGFKATVDRAAKAVHQRFAGTDKQ